MNTTKTKPATIEEYIKSCPEHVQDRLHEMHKFIKEILPAEATEVISYGIAAFDLNNKHVVFFAGYKNHTSIYPFPSSVKEFEKYSEKYETSAGTIKFKNDEPIPWDIIKEIVEFRLQENIQKAAK